MSTTERTRAREEQAELQVELRLHETLRAMALADIKAPLMEISLSASVIERVAPAGGARLAEATQDIRDAVARAIALLSALAEDGDGAPSVDLRVQGVAEVLSAAVSAVGPLAKARDVRVESSVGAERALCDRARTVRAMVTLLCLALRRTAGGGCVKVEAETAGSMLHLLVRDQGDMMSEDEVERTLSPAIVDTAWPPSRDAGRARRAITVQGGALRVRRAPEGMVFEASFPAPTQPRETRS